MATKRYNPNRDAFRDKYLIEGVRIGRCSICKKKDVEGDPSLIAGKPVCKECRKEWVANWQSRPSEERDKILFVDRR